MSGDYAVKGLDFDTYLVGPVTDKIVDADRIARAHVDNGFPNWALYRTVYAGDSHLRTQLRDWCVAFAVAAAEGGLVRKGLPHEEMGALAGWDAYYRLHNARWVIAGQDIADVAGVDPKTYRKLRNYVYSANVASMNRYFVEMQIAIRRVWQMEREQGVAAAEPSRMSHGRGFGDIAHVGDGCYWASPLTASGGPGVWSPDMRKAGL